MELPHVDFVVEEAPKEKSNVEAFGDLGVQFIRPPPPCLGKVVSKSARTPVPQ